MFGDFTRVTGVLLLLWTFITAVVAEEEPVGRITSVECTTTAADDPFTIEVSLPGMHATVCCNALHVHCVVCNGERRVEKIDLEL